MLGEDIQRLREGAQALGLEIDAKAEEQFQFFVEILERWNQKNNLTAITGSDIIPLHFLDSLCLLSHGLKKFPATSLLDVGSGPGLPGIPCAILRSEMRVALLEASAKKCDFLRAARQKLDLPRLEILEADAKQLARKAEYQSVFDIVTARALSALPELLKLLVPFCRNGGHIIAMKAGDIEEELAAAQPVIEKNALVLAEAVKFRIPTSDRERSLVIFRKEG